MHTPFDQAWFTSAGGHAAGCWPPRRAPSAAVPRPAQDRRGPEPARTGAMRPTCSTFVGRADELARLRRWVLRRALPAGGVLGMGGIGKTSLAARLARDAGAGLRARVLAQPAERPARRASGWPAPSASSPTSSCVPPAGEAERLAVLLELLREQPLPAGARQLRDGARAGPARGPLSGRVWRVRRAAAGGRRRPAPELPGADQPRGAARAGRARRRGGPQLAARRPGRSRRRRRCWRTSSSSATSGQWAELVARYGGNGLALKVVGESIRELFGGEIGAFLDGGGGQRRLRGHSAAAGRAGRAPLGAGAAGAARAGRGARAGDAGGAAAATWAARVGRGAGAGGGRGAAPALAAGARRDAGAAAFTLQSVVLEYVTDRLVADVAEEIDAASRCCWWSSR